MLDFDLFGIERLEADAYSSAGYLMALLSFVTLLPVALFFIEPPKQATPGISFPSSLLFLLSGDFVLFCFVLFCFVLFCFVLFCFVLFCFVLFCFVLFCFVLFCFSLFCFVLFCFVLFCFVLFCFVGTEMFADLLIFSLSLSLFYLPSSLVQKQPAKTATMASWLKSTYKSSSHLFGHPELKSIKKNI